MKHLFPLQEYQRTDDRVADFELSIKLMDAINVLASCRIDSVQQSTDFIIKLRDIDLGEFDEKGENKSLKEYNAICKHISLRLKAVTVLMCNPILMCLIFRLTKAKYKSCKTSYTKCCKKNYSNRREVVAGQDTGIAVENRNGFRQFENLATEISDSMIYSEMQFVEKLLEIGKSYPNLSFQRFGNWRH